MRGLKSRRGLSSIITSAMLLTAVGVMGTSIVGWSNSNLKTYETSLQNSTATYGNKISENLSIENVAFCATSPSCDNGQSNPGVNVTLTNTGNLYLKITRIQFNSTDYTSKAVNVGGSSPAVSLPANIPPKQSILLDISPFTWHSKSVSTITVTTSRGSIFTTQVSPP
ncbi:MAG TPA: hypothetical protein VJ792_06750 [Candidatus Nitrosotalea sp.]|nr:hypothetical protein [Candidatus Nitrosotalea sp.]